MGAGLKYFHIKRAFSDIQNQLSMGGRVVLGSKSVLIRGKTSRKKAQYYRCILRNKIDIWGMRGGGGGYTFVAPFGFTLNYPSKKSKNDRLLGLHSIIGQKSRKIIDIICAFSEKKKSSSRGGGLKQLW